jgi:hypothetical protein
VQGEAVAVGAELAAAVLSAVATAAAEPWSLGSGVRPERDLALDGGPSAQPVAALGESERTAAAAPGGTVRVRVMGVLAGAGQDSERFGVADATVELWQGGDAPPFAGPAQTRRTDGDGSAEFASLPPGSFRLRAALGFGSEGITSAVAAEFGDRRSQELVGCSAAAACSASGPTPRIRSTPPGSRRCSAASPPTSRSTPPSRRRAPGSRANGRSAR